MMQIWPRKRPCWQYAWRTETLTSCLGPALLRQNAAVIEIANRAAWRPVEHGGVLAHIRLLIPVFALSLHILRNN